MPNLKQDNLRLYKQVRLQAIVHALIGASLLFMPIGATGTAGNLIQQQVGKMLEVFGIMYFVVAGIMIAGLFVSRNTYSLARKGIFLAWLYSMVWGLLMVLILTGNFTRGIGFITVLFWLIAISHWYLYNDPGWKAIDVVNELMRNGNGSDKRTTK